MEVEQVADRGQAQFDGRCREVTGLHFDPGRHMQRLHRRNRRHAVIVAPGQEVRHSAAVGSPRVRVADRRREEFQKAPRRPSCHTKSAVCSFSPKAELGREFQAR